METNNGEIAKIRLRLIDLIKSFFVTKPDAELFSRWRGTFSALAKEQISPVLDNAVRELNQQLAEKSLEVIQDEYYSLFVDPFGENNLNLLASYYFDGRNYGETLVAMRTMFSDSSIVKDKKVTDPEDSLPIMFDLLGTLIDLEKQGEDTASSQQELIHTYLVPFLNKLKPAVAVNQAADFYKFVIDFSIGYLDLEKGLSDYSA